MLAAVDNGMYRFLESLLIAGSHSCVISSGDSAHTRAPGRSNLAVTAADVP